MKSEYSALESRQENEMSEPAKRTQIAIDGVDYVYEDLTPKQQRLVSHCLDLDQKINAKNIILEQLLVGKQSFIKLLKEELAAPAEESPIIIQ